MPIEKPPIQDIEPDENNDEEEEAEDQPRPMDETKARREVVEKVILANPQEFWLLDSDELPLDSDIVILKDKPLRGRKLQPGEAVVLHGEHGEMAAEVVSTEKGKINKENQQTVSVTVKIVK